MGSRRVPGSLWTVVLAMLLLLGTGVVAARAQADIRAQWAKSAHAKRELTAEATVEVRGPAAAHCGRCHSEQGFRAWLPQMQAGNPGLIAKPDGSPADLPYLASLGLTRFSVRPITCNACHTTDFKLRQVGSTPLLPAGFRAIGVGLGAQCMTCHNSRNGAITWNRPDPGRYQAPHVASQADVLMGKNVYFLDYGNNFISPHATFIGDSCVTCHVRMSKAPHAFAAETTVCSRCHGADVTASRVQETTHTLMAELEKAIAGRILAAKERIQVITSWDPKTDKDTPNTAVDPAAIVGVELTEIHGQQAVKLNLTGGRALYSQLGNLKDNAGRPTFATSDPVVRAGWNYFLLHGDSSEGIHNPRFYRQTILTTLDALR
ncbi:MAG: cytochrome c3 family protein [Armatimonadota bacterium]|nr:cytochrome c3 family protein [Armatimonadota bacterium]